MTAGPRHTEGLVIPSLDGIRCVAFLMVFLAHAGLEGLIPGGFGVTVFFFLSGYLITTLLRLELTKYGKVSLKKFYARRLLRIWPPFYLVLGGAILATLWGVLTMPLVASRVAAQLLHVTNYEVIAYDKAGIPPGTGVYWSLAVEEHFYLMFPLLLGILWRRGLELRQQALVLWSICAVVFLWRCYLVLGVGVTEYRTYLATDTRIDSILFGCALALYGNPALDRSRFSDVVWQRRWLPLGLLLLASTFLIRSPVFRETLRYSIQGIGLAAFFVVAIRTPQWGPFQVLNWRVTRWIGVLSYSLYLLHFCVLHAVWDHWPLNPVLQAAIALLLSIAISQLLYWIVEQPAARLRKRLSHT